ncbi:MAG TPA: DUF5067 domain-containing protein [Nocardioides sp.]|uniref:DUF5067 domain-containing protein n=1 Tax=Nocardioides sp. TaxID=35761 RepID=UPI002ED857FD
MSDPHFPDAPAGATITAPQGSNGLATAGFVLGLLGVLTCWIPILNVLGILLGILGVVLAAVGFAKSRKVGTGKGLSIAGIVLGTLAVLLAVLINVAFSQAVDEALDGDDADVPSSTVAASPDSAASNRPADSDESGSAEATFKDGVLTTSDVKIVITSHKVIPVGKKGNEYGDKPVLAFWYKITNLTDKDTSPMDWIYYFSAYQDNNPNAENELDVAALPDDQYLDSQTENIKKGGTVENAMAYELDDKATPVELVANESLGFGDDLGRVTYQLK